MEKNTKSFGRKNSSDDKKTSYGNKKSYNKAGSQYKSGEKSAKGGKSYRGDKKTFANSEKSYRADKKTFANSDKPYRTDKKTDSSTSKTYRAAKNPASGKNKYTAEKRDFNKKRKFTPGERIIKHDKKTAVEKESNILDNRIEIALQALIDVEKNGKYINLAFKHNDKLDKLEEKTNDYLQKYSSAVTESIPCDPNNAISTRYKTIEFYYTSNFKDKWDSLDSETKKNLVSAVCLWQLINDDSQIKEIISYRCITNPLAVALECEVKKRFFKCFKSWYYENYKPTYWRDRPQILNYVRFKPIDQLSDELGLYDSKQMGDLLNQLSAPSLSIYICGAKVDADLAKAKQNAKCRISNTQAVNCVKKIVSTFGGVLNKDEYLMFPDDLLEWSDNDRFLIGELKWMMNSKFGKIFADTLNGNVDSVVSEVDRLRTIYRNPTSHIDDNRPINAEFTRSFMTAMLGNVGENDIPVFEGSFIDNLCGIERRE